MNDIVKEYRMIKAEYAYKADIMCEDDPRVIRLKKIIDEQLSAGDKTIFLLYIYYQSFRKVGRKLNLSHMTVRREYLRVKKLVMDEYYRNDIH